MGNADIRVLCFREMMVLYEMRGGLSSGGQNECLGLSGSGINMRWWSLVRVISQERDHCLKHLLKRCPFIEVPLCMWIHSMPYETLHCKKNQHS